MQGYLQFFIKTPRPKQVSTVCFLRFCWRCIRRVISTEEKKRFQVCTPGAPLICTPGYSPFSLSRATYELRLLISKNLLLNKIVDRGRPLLVGRGSSITVFLSQTCTKKFHFFWNNHKDFFDYGSTTRNSMRNLSIQCVFLNNLIFQLFNHFILPSSMLARLVNIYLFRCNNKIFFVTSGFLGWLIGHILFMKWNSRRSLGKPHDCS